jgi:hypothetical protein
MGIFDVYVINLEVNNWNEGSSEQQEVYDYYLETFVILSDRS